MLRRIVSGGQTGVDRAALDVAVELGVACGGWCPRGRLAEDGVIPATYPLVETPSSEYQERTLWNVRDSDGTLVLTWGAPTEGTALTIEMAHGLNKPCLVVDLDEPVELSAVENWLRAHRIAVLNVGGPRASKSGRIYGEAADFLRAVLRILERGGLVSIR